MRIIERMNIGRARVIVYHDSHLNEFKCVLKVGGKNQPDADYFTDDQDDAIATAEKMARQANDATYTRPAS